MSRSAFVTLLCVVCLSASVSGFAQEETKPPYERLLTGKDAEKANDLTSRANEAEASDNYEEAIRQHQELLDLRTAVQGKDHWETVSQQWTLDQTQRVAAISPDKRSGWRKAINGLSEIQRFVSQDQPSRAETLQRQHLKWCREILGEKHPVTAESYSNLGYILKAQGKFGDAQPMYQKALDIFRESLGNLHPNTATTYNNLAMNIQSQGQYVDADPLIRNALDIRLKLLGEKHADTAQSYNNLAVNFYFRGNYSEAGYYYKVAFELRTAVLGAKHIDTAEGYNNLGMNLLAQGKVADARPYLQTALNIYRENLGAKHRLVAMGYNNLALQYEAQKKYADAQPLLQQALDLLLELLGDKHQLTARAFNNLGMNLSAQRKFADAEPLLRKALDLNNELLQEMHPETAGSYNNLALVINAQGKYAEAQHFFQKALDLHLLVLGQNHPSTAWIQNNLAANLTAQGQYEEAENLLTQAARSFEAARLGVAGRGFDRALFGAERSPYPLLAALRARLDSPVAAWLAAESDLARGMNDEGVFRRGASLTASEQSQYARLDASLTKLQPRLSRLMSKPAPSMREQEELSTLKSERLRIEVEHSNLAVIQSQRALAPLSAVQSAISEDAALALWVNVSVSGVQEHWGCVIRRNGEPVWEQLAGSNSRSKLNDDDLALPAKLRKALASGSSESVEVNALAAALSNQRITPLLRHLDGVKTLYVVAVNEMAGIPVELLTDKFTISYVPSGTFLARLKDKATSDSGSLLAVADPVFERPDQQPDDPKPLPPGGLLIITVAPNSPAAVALLQPRDLLLSYAGEDLTSGKKLTELIQSKSDASRETPAAAIQIPITVWREGQDRPFTRNVPPGRLGVTLDKEPAPQAIANLRKTEAMLLTLRGGDWRELPGTRIELAQVARLFGTDARTLLDSAASEQSLEELRKSGELSKYRYLHFATHGEANSVRAFESTLIMSQDRLPKDPLPRAGEPFINGQLSANEVLEYWKLDAELVTLSACETAIGRDGGGDGLLGFAQAFLTAGSRAVCLSLWKVDDTATSLLMSRFYQNLLGKRPGLDAPMPKSAALHEAKRWLRELSEKEAQQLIAESTKGLVRGERGGKSKVKIADPPKEPARDDSKPYAHPRYWSAFILIGDPN